MPLVERSSQPCRSPVAIRDRLGAVETTRGVSESMMPPSPTWPASLRPQHSVLVLVAFIAHVKLEPAETETATAPATDIGVSRLVVVPSPS